MFKRCLRVLLMSMIFTGLIPPGYDNLPAVYAAAEKCTIESVVQRPWIINDNGTLKTETELLINNSSAEFKAWIKISVTGKKSYIQEAGKLAKGTNKVIVNVVELNQDGDRVTFELYSNSACSGKPLSTKTVKQKKIRHWKVYVAHDMHTDFGYTDYQEDLKDNIWPGYLDDAFTHIKSTEALDDKDKFRYPIEVSSMLLDSAMQVRNADWIEELKGYLKQKRITYPSDYMSFASENMGAEELVRSYYYSERYLKDMLGVPSNKVVNKSDDPGFSWSNIDVMADSGVKYLILRPNATQYTAYPRLLYYQGRNTDNKILTYNGTHYGTDEMEFRSPDSSITFAACTGKIMDYNTDKYTGDAILLNFTTPYDNKGITGDVIKNIKEMNAKKDSKGRDYVYPQFISSTTDDFFQYVETNYSKSIPVYKGTIENWWNYGVSSAAYETGINKSNHEKVPAAEFLATMASVFSSGTPYPYEDIANAYKYMLFFDEHSWGNEVPQPDDQWIWKRNNAITSNTLSEKVANASLNELNKLIPAQGPTIVVYNTLSWSRSDIVSVKQSGLPEYFDIVDIETGKSVAHQKLADGNIVFEAENIPGLGYKCFSVEKRTSAPVFEPAIKISSNTIENDFFKVTFDKSGSISSIIDKQNGNMEMVDKSAPYMMNEFIYYTTVKMGFDVKTESTVKSSAITGNSGPVMGVMTADGITEGISGLKRNVILYNNIPRIDIVNDVVKTDAVTYASEDEEGFFVFPLNIPGFQLRHEIPAGTVKPYVDRNIDNPDNEQFFGSSTAYYTVNRWIDASGTDDYGITLSLLSNPIVQYGERRSALGQITYNTKNPWIFNFVFNNKWHVNFQKTQPGPVTFKYSLRPYKGVDWRSGRPDIFGAETSNELMAYVISSPQTGSGLSGIKGSFIGISEDNVVLTTAKIAEANDEGLILRFNETLGVDTKVEVDLSNLLPAEVKETDLMENNLRALTMKDNKISFDIKGYGWKTIRVTRGDTPPQVTGVNAVSGLQGTVLKWDAVGNEGAVCYEIFRDTVRDFVLGSGNYLATVSKNSCYDAQVGAGSENKYYYVIRAVLAGKKGSPSAAVTPVAGEINDTEAPTAPMNLKAVALSDRRATLSWEASDDVTGIKGYRIFRDGKEIKEVDVVINSYLDTGVTPDKEYSYSVRAYDFAGNESVSSNMADVTTPDATTYTNVAVDAECTASSEYSTEYGADKVIDGIIGVHGKGEWASAGEANPWIKLQWETDKTIKMIRIYDRQNLLDNTEKVQISFSDGTSIDLDDIPAGGEAATIEFTPREIRWVKFTLSGNGDYLGLSEIQVIGI